MIYILSLLLFFQSSQTKEKCELKITVTDIKTLTGSIEIGIFNNEKTFLKKGAEYKTYSKRVIDETLVFVIKDLKKDDYAISLYHDINSDEKCNLNFLGKPKEPYGFSNNFKPFLFKPSFKDCKIEVYKNTSVTIRLID